MSAVGVRASKDNPHKKKMKEMIAQDTEQHKALHNVCLFYLD